MEELKKKIKNRKANIAVVGLGYVGLPVACLLAKAGFSVVGINRGQEKVDLVNRGVSPIEGKEPGLKELLKKVIRAKKLTATTNYSICKEADVVLIAVETPIDSKERVPKYESLKSALNSLGGNLKKGALVIIESTIAPGTMENIVRPALEKASKKTLNKDFYLGHCPERVMPGKLLKNLQNYHRVVGGSTPKTAQIMKQLYKTYVKGDLDTTDVTTAEVVKTTENYYRDVEIAFANQLALLCGELGVNVHEARELINKVEDRNIHMPGAGVGGHCIPKDGLLNVALMRKRGNSDAKLALEMADLARKINDFMPIHMVTLLKKGLKEAGREIDNSKIIILGYAYLANSDDTRNSPTEKLLNNLKPQGKNIEVHDPYVVRYNKDLLIILRNSDAVVLMVAHDQYKALKLEQLKKWMRTKVLIDGRNIFDKEKAKAAGFIYKGVGNV